tara:strand:- start:163 stop:444 length:282 start_codon:yes stop_codon:yes gene_type:complete
MKKSYEIDLVKNIKYDYEITVPKGSYNDSVDYVLLGIGTAEIYMIEKENINLAEVKLLKDMKKKLQADAQIAIEKIEEKIQSLLAISHDGSAQ